MTLFEHCNRGTRVHRSAAVFAVLLGISSGSRAADDANPYGHWVGVLEHRGRSWRIEIDLGIDQGHVVGSASYPDGGRFDLPFTGVRASGNHLDLSHNLDRGMVVMRGTYLGDEYTGTWHGLQIDATFRLRRVAREGRTLKEVPVRFRHGRVVLAGTLVLPITDPPYPVAVWIHGSGHVGRAQRSYRMWGHLLARHGIACLLYDKRGVGASTGSFHGASMEELAGDALAGLHTLSRFPDIDPLRMGVGGFSQGGLIAPLVYSHNKRLTFVMVVSASGLSPWEQSTYVMANRLRAAGFEPGVIELATSLRRRLGEYTHTGVGGPALTKDLQRVLHEPWFTESRLAASSLKNYRKAMPGWAFLDPVPLWRRVSVPVLGVWGENDQLVPPHESLDSISRALKEAGNTDTTLRIVPGTMHDMMRVPEGPPARYSAGDHRDHADEPGSDRAGSQTEDKNPVHKNGTNKPPSDWDWPRIAPELEPLFAEWMGTHVTHTPSPTR